MTDNPPSALDVVTEALTTALPCPSCGSTTPCRCIPAPEAVRVRDRALLVVGALQATGWLPTDEPEPDPPTLADIHQTARWLAERSGHPRYAGDGWHRIMQSDADVAMAFTQASYSASNADLENLNAARRLLIEHHRANGHEAPRG